MMNESELINRLAHSIAQEQFDKLVGVAEEMTAKARIGEHVRSFMPFSNYICPICGVMDLQPLRRKWLFFKYGKNVEGYACQTEHCPAKGIIVSVGRVEAIRHSMVHEIRSCPNCGASVPPTYKFCGTCGARLV